MRRLARNAAPPAAALLLVLLIHMPLAAASDLVIADLTIEPQDPFAGSRLEFSAVIENRGDDRATAQFFVLFEIDGQFHESVAVNGGIRSEKAATVTSSWIAEAGDHVVEVFVDHPLDRVAEEDESNNSLLIEISIPWPDDVAQRIGGLKIAVGRFEDHSGSGWVNVGDGVADKLGQRLDEAGIRTVQHDEYTERMQQEGLNPFSSADAEAGARLLGADLLLTGSVEDLVTEEFSMSLGPLSLGHGAAEATVCAEIHDLSSPEPIVSLAASGRSEGTTEFSIDLGDLLASASALNLCSGGLRTDRDAYRAGESVSIGYLNPGAADWLGVQIYTTTGTFLRWLGWQYVESLGCEQWFWDQRDSFGIQVDPGVYVAKLWDGATHVATVNVQIQPGWSLFPLFEEITVGSAQFDESLVGMAIDQAVDRLVADLVASLEARAPFMTASQVLEAGEAEGAFQLTGQVAAILPDGRIAINVGDASGVVRGDFFEVVDPADLDVRGEIVIVEVRESISYAIATSSFEASIGDIVRRTEP